MTLRAVETGSAAAARLHAGGTRRVVAVFRHTAYLDDAICLAGPGLPLGPLVARLPALPRLEVGDTVAIEPGPVWEAPPCRCPDPAGLRAALAATVRRADWKAWYAAWPSRAAADDMLGLVAELPGGAQALVGLGPGLTPAGDDALAGYALACRALGWPTPTVDLTRTGEISGALLACALAGLPGEDEGSLITQPSAAAADRLAAHGATSGLATILGMLAALAQP